MAEDEDDHDDHHVDARGFGICGQEGAGVKQGGADACVDKWGGTNGHGEGLQRHKGENSK